MTQFINSGEILIRNVVKRYVCAQSGHKPNPKGIDRPFDDGVGVYCFCGYKPTKVSGKHSPSPSSLFFAG